MPVLRNTYACPTNVRIAAGCIQELCNESRTFQAALQQNWQAPRMDPSNTRKNANWIIKIITNRLLVTAVYMIMGTYLGPIALVVLSWFIGWPVAQGVRLVAWLAGSPIETGKLSPFLVLPLTGTILLLFVVLPAILFAKEHALADVRRGIHASLAAAMPEHPGGPSRCRSCGAALDIPQGALGVPCVYCGADNLVALPEAWVTHVRSSDYQEFKQITTALDTYREVSYATHERLFWFSISPAILFPILLVSAWILRGMTFTY